MAELADAEDLKSSGLYARAGSSPAPGKNFISAHILKVRVNVYNFRANLDLNPQ